MSIHEDKKTASRAKRSAKPVTRVSNAICVEMTRAAYETYRENWREKGFCKEALIRYLNQTGGFLGTVTDIAVVE